MNRQNLKRLLVFCFETYYPGGGLNDLSADFDTIEEVRAYSADHVIDGVLDRVEGRELEPGEWLARETKE